jgi:putative ABC transport system permease protein
MVKNPPRLAQWLLARLSGRDERLSILGDFQEIYTEKYRLEGVLKANSWYWSQVLKSIPLCLKNKLYWAYSMVTNYTKIAFRNMLKYKGYSIINILGLAVGMACFILVLLWINDELSYDKFHKNANCIYRVIHNEVATTQAPLAQALLEEFPEVLNTVRVTRPSLTLIRFKSNQFWEEDFIFTDASIFNMFTFPLIKGDPETALNDLHSIVITEKMAKKYFGREDPIGKTLRVGKENIVDYKVTGVLENIPSNSQLKFNFLTSFQHLQHNIGWGQWNYYTYIHLKSGSTAQEFEKKMPDFIERHLGKETRQLTKYYLQPLTKIHLHSKLRLDLKTNGDIMHIYLFAGIGLLILSIACINFMNLATANSVTREKEVGLRKVLGAQRGQVRNQFLGEALIITLVAWLLSLLLVLIFLPLFSNLTGKVLAFSPGLSFWLFLIFVTLLVGFVSGSYPALFISSFHPIAILRGEVGSSIKRGSMLRKILVVTQFVLSIVFMASTIVIFRQIDYVHNKDQGYNKDYLVVLPIYFEGVKEKVETFKIDIKKFHNVVNATATSYIPGRAMYYQNAWWEGLSIDDYNTMMHWIPVDADFIDTLGVKLIYGRDFFKEMPSDIGAAYIINERAVKETGWHNPLGKAFKILKRGPVIGVVKDFHFRSFHHKIEPISLVLYPQLTDYLLVRIQDTNINGTLQFLKNRWQKFFPNQIFNYSFFDDDFEGLYAKEIKLAKVMNIVALLAIFIAGLGLFGLASYTILRRKKEIGIRKVLGASVSQILLMLIREFSVWVIIANFFAWPMVYYIMNSWLRNFKYHVNVDAWSLLLAGTMAVIIAVITVSYQATRGATSNPVETLRNE